MSSFTAVVRIEPTFNVYVPALPNHTFIYIDEESSDSASWSPYADLADDIRGRL
jgi:hypothetical protein